MQELFPCTTTITDVAREGAYARVTKHRGTPYWIPGDSDSSSPTPRVEEYTDALFPVSCEWIKAIPLDCYPTDLALIHKSCMIKGRNMEKIQGKTPNSILRGAVTTMQSRHDVNGVYVPPQAQNTSNCEVCSYNNTDMTCAGTNCTTRAHTRCHQQHTPWRCTACSPIPHRPEPLHPRVLNRLKARAKHNTIYSASDGSVLHAGTPQASSTFGISIDPDSVNVKRYGKINIRQGEESSLRTELEGLIQAYHLIPTIIDVTHAVDNLGAVDIHNRLLTHGLPCNRALMHLNYHTTIKRLHNAMLTRGRPLQVVHTLSHMENTKTNDTQLHARRRALAVADTAAGESHGLEPITPDNTFIEAFPLYINGVRVEKTADTPFAKIQRDTRLHQLYERKMEGANARTGTLPTWGTGRRTWPHYLRTFAHKLWTKRLPTAHNRAKRGDTEDDVPVMPWCPHCLKQGDTNLETHTHLMETCPSLATSKYKLARTINNIFRTSAAPTPIAPPIPLTEEEGHLETIGVDWSHTTGWETHTTDKHGRETPMCQGPEGREIDGTHLLTSWVHSTLKYCEQHLPWETHKQYLEQMTPESSIDPHLLQGLASAIQADHIYDVISHNPFIPAQTLSNTELPSGNHPAIFNTIDTLQDWEALGTALPQTRTWVLLASEDQADIIDASIEYTTKVVIKANTVKQWGRSFWSGKAGLFPCTVDHDIHIYMPNTVTQYQRSLIQDTIYMRSNSGGTLTDTPDIQPYTLMAETPKLLANLLASTNISPAKTQLLSGGITIETMADWKDTLPPRIHQKLYRQLHQAIIAHQHDIWLRRNETAHPDQDEPFIAPNYNRKRVHSQIVNLDDVIPEDVRWKRTRTKALRAEDAWKKPPAPRTTTNRKRRLAMLANPTAQPKRRRHAINTNSQATRKRTHSLQGGDGEGSSDPEDDSPGTKRSRNMQDTGPTAPQHSEESVQNQGGPSGALEEEVEASAERSQGIHGPPPSATAEVRVRFPRATGQ